MGLQFQKRARIGRHSSLNASKSGLSLSSSAGPFTFNSRGRASIRLGKGFSYRTSGGAGLIAMIVYGVISMCVAAIVICFKAAWLLAALAVRATVWVAEVVFWAGGELLSLARRRTTAPAAREVAPERVDAQR